VSGATITRQRGKRYELRLSTPSISFALDPPGTSPTQEQRYHANAARSHAAALAPLEGALDTALEALDLLELDDALPEVAHGGTSPVPCRWTFVVSRSPPGWSDLASVTVATACYPATDERMQIRDRITSCLHEIVDAHRRKIVESAPPEASLRPCIRCGRPTLLGAGRDVLVNGVYQPDCCWRRHDRIRMWLVVSAVFVIALAIVIALTRR
jgi:hypothetical protein